MWFRESCQDMFVNEVIYLTGKAALYLFMYFEKCIWINQWIIFVGENNAIKFLILFLVLYIQWRITASYLQFLFVTEWSHKTIFFSI